MRAGGAEKQGDRGSLGRVVDRHRLMPSAKAAGHTCALPLQRRGRAQHDTRSAYTGKSRRGGAPLERAHPPANGRVELAAVDIGRRAHDGANTEDQHATALVIVDVVGDFAELLVNEVGRDAYSVYLLLQPLIFRRWKVACKTVRL